MFNSNKYTMLFFNRPTYVHKKSTLLPKISNCNNPKTLLLILFVLNSFILVYYGIESYVIQVNTTNIDKFQNSRSSAVDEQYNSFNINRNPNNSNNQNYLNKASLHPGFVYNHNSNVDAILKNSSQKYNSYPSNLDDSNVDVISEGSGNGPPLSNQKQRNKKPKFDDTEGDEDDDDDDEEDEDYDYRDNIDSGSGQGNVQNSNLNKQHNQSIIMNFSKPHSFNSQNSSVSSANYSSTDKKNQAYLPFRPPQHQQAQITTLPPQLNNFNNQNGNPVIPTTFYTSPKPAIMTNISMENFIQNQKNSTPTSNMKLNQSNINTILSHNSTLTSSKSDLSFGSRDSVPKQNNTKVTDKDYDYNYEDDSENIDDESEESINFEDDESTDDNNSSMNNKNLTTSQTSPTTMTMTTTMNPITLNFRPVTTPPTLSPSIDYNKQVTHKFFETHETTTSHPITTTTITQLKPAIWQTTQFPTPNISSNNITKDINFAQSKSPPINNYLTTTVLPINKYTSTQSPPKGIYGDKIRDEDGEEIEDDDEEEEEDDDSSLEESLNENKFNGKTVLSNNSFVKQDTILTANNSVQRPNNYQNQSNRETNHNYNHFQAQTPMQPKVIETTTTTTFSPINIDLINNGDRWTTNRPQTTGSPLRMPSVTQPPSINIFNTIPINTQRNIEATTTKPATTTTITVAPIVYPSSQQPIYHVLASTLSPPRVSLLPDFRYYPTTQSPKSVNTYTINPNILAYDKSMQDDNGIIKQIYDKSVEVYQVTNKAFEDAVEALNAFELKINQKTFEPLFADSLKFMLSLGGCVVLFVLTMLLLVYLIDKKTQPQPQEPDSISIY